MTHDGKVITHKRKESMRSRLFTVMTYVMFILFALVCIYPFWYIFICTISSNALVNKGEIFLWPREIHFTNYSLIFNIEAMIPAALMSLYRTVLGTVCTTLVSVYMGYLFTKPMWGRKFWYRFIVITQYFSAGLIPTFLIYHNIGLTRSFWVYILPWLIIPFYIIVSKTYIESIPPSLEESAKVDGAGLLTSFFRIIFPLSMPIVATVAIWIAVAQWNSFYDTLMYNVNLGSNQYNTLQYVLYKYVSKTNTLLSEIRANASVNPDDIQKLMNPTTVQMTVAMIVTIPVLFVYPIFQKHFTKGIMLGAVKG